MKPCLVVVFICSFCFYEIASEEREVVVWIQETANTIKYIDALQTSVARFFESYSGRGTKFSFTIYRMSIEDQLEKSLERSRDPDEVTGTFGRMLANPLPVNITCRDLCCAGPGLKTHFSEMIQSHPGSLLLVAVDEIPYYSEEERLNLEYDLRQAKITLFFVRAAASYCMIDGAEKLSRFGVTKFLFLLDVPSFQNIFDLVLMHYDNKFLGYQGWGTCPNKTHRLILKAPQEVQGITLYLPFMRQTRPLEIIDPTGTPRDYFVHFEDVDNGFALVSVFGGCEPGWTLRDGQCYFRRPGPSTWTRANDDCRQYNATLLSAVSGRLPQALLDDDKLWEQDADLQLPQTTWLTLRDDNSQKEFYWKLFARQIALKHLNISNWAAGEPSSGIPAGSRCVRADRNSQWTTSLCFSLLPYVCTKPAMIFEQEGQRQFVPNGDWLVQLDSLIGCTIFDFQFY